MAKTSPRQRTRNAVLARRRGGTGRGAAGCTRVGDRALHAGGAARRGIRRDGRPDFGSVPRAGTTRRIGVAGGIATAARHGQRKRCRHEDAIADAHQRVGVPLLLVEPVTPPAEPLAEPLPLVPGPPIELVLPEVPPLPEGLVVPAVLPEPVPLPEGLVVLEELVEPVPPVEPAVPASRLSQALSERAATMAKVAAAH